MNPVSIVNKSGKKTLLFGIGLLAGFFSEINMMIIAIVYCMHHNIKFKLHSGNANFKLDKGWTDYFQSFCEEINNSYTDKYDAREKIIYTFDIKKPKRIYRMLKYKASLWFVKKKYGFDYFTFDIWDNVCNRNLEKIHFYNKELKIDGSLQHACNKIANSIWRYNERTQNNINSIKLSLNLPEKYLGFQIRRGDKFLESEPIKLQNYVDIAAQKSDCQNAFILTDDYSVIEEFKTIYPNWNIYTLCDKNEKGYTHKEFFSQNTPAIYNGIIRLLANIEILRNSEHFIGTHSANPSMFLGMIMEPEKVHSVDVPWQVWFGKVE